MQRSKMPLKSGGNLTAGKFQALVPKGVRGPGATGVKGNLKNELPGSGHSVPDSIASFACVPADRTDQKITALLQQILDSCRLDWCGLMTLTSDKTGLRAILAAHGEGIAAAPEAFALRICDIPWTGENLLRGDIVCFSSLTELPPEAKSDRRHYNAMGVRSSLAIPIYVDGSMEYFIVAHLAHAGHSWRKETISQLRLIGEIFVNALASGRDGRGMDRCLQFEQLMTDLSIRFINVTAGEVDREIIAALEQVRSFSHFDCFGLITFSHDKRVGFATHLSCGEGVAPVPDKVDISTLFPWATEKLLHGETISFASLGDLPEEAAVDRRSWEMLGIQSHFSVPIRVGDFYEYFVVASHVHAAHPVARDLFPRVCLLGEIFANALARCKVEAAQHENCVEMRLLSEKLQAETEYLQSEQTFPVQLEKIIGQSVTIAKTLALAGQVAPTDSTVLICGETGTGKELIAEAIHKLSARRNKLMVKVNCASLPAALVESELFGRERGAYTGALTRQAGRFELANGGTIFLDEISEMSLELQAKLLRVLQEGEFERLGSTNTIQVNVRVIAATNRNLAEEVKKGSFREDLYYRLNVFPIIVPPLRERFEDIPLLVWSFVDELGKKMGKKITKISKQDMTDLQRFPWPGNVRELRNVIEHAVIVSSGDRLHVLLPESAPGQTGGMLTLEESEMRHIREALRLTNWRIKGEGGAARLLGINPSTLYSRMQKLGISNRHLKDEMSP